MPDPRSIWRFLAATTLAFWLGGFTFYAAIVIPTAHHVLGDHTAVGFVTRKVALWLNGLCAVALAALAGEMAATLHERRLGLGKLATWLVLAVTLAWLTWQHHVLDSLLDAESMSVADAERFYSRHRVYLIVATVQWLAGVGHWCWLMGNWIDRRAVRV